MANLFDYVTKYGDTSFQEKAFNEVDNLILSTLSYLDFSDTIIDSNQATLESIGKEYLSKHTYKKVRRLGIAMKDAYQLLELLITKERYQNIILKDYVYKTNEDMQFSALTFWISKKLKYICFEGTDEQISGWKEDFKMASTFPVPAHTEAIRYVNEHVSIFGEDVIIGGHSKGGNLALVASMYMKTYKSFKVKKVYSNDGPGLRQKEFLSKQYQKVKSKYIHIVPNSSMIGILLYNDSYQVVKSSKQNLLGHAMSTWMIEDDHILKSELSEKSKRLEAFIISWIETHTDQEKQNVTNHLFKVIEDANIKETFGLVKLKNLPKLNRNLKQMDKHYKQVAYDLFSQAMTV